MEESILKLNDSSIYWLMKEHIGNCRKFKLWKLFGFVWQLQYAAFIQTSSTLGSGGRGYYELYAVRNKTLVLKIARADAVLNLRLYIKNSYHGEVMLLCGLIWKNCCERLTPKACVSLPAPRSYHTTAIMGVCCSYTHLRRLRSPPHFNQSFIVLPRTPP